MKAALLVALASLGGGVIALFGMLFLHNQPVDDDDIHGDV